MHALPLAALLTTLLGLGGCSSNPDIEGLPDGVTGLVVLNDDYDRLYVDGHAAARPEPHSKELKFEGGTSNCADEGLAGYAVDESATEVRLTVVVGESGWWGCNDERVAHEGVAMLQEKLGNRQVVITQPL